MSAIGIDFVIKMSTAAFTAGMAKMSNATRDLRRGLAKNFDGRDLARGLVTAFGLSIDKIAEKVARLWTGMSEEAEANYNKLGDLTDTLAEKTLEANRAKLNDEQRYQLALMESARLQRAIAENAGKTTEDQIKLTEDKIALLDKQKEAAESLAKVEKDKAEREKKDKEATAKWNEDEWEKNQARLKDIADEDARELEKKEKREEAIREKFAPTVEQLAQMEVGGFSAADDPRLKARQIMELEKRAGMLGGRGDIAGAIKLGGEATTMRESLAKVAGGGTALTAETAEAALRNALNDTNKELSEVKTALSGIIKAQ